MTPNLAFDIYPPPDDTPLGARLVRLTSHPDDEDSGGQYGLGTTYLHGKPMGTGKIVVEKTQPFVTATNFAVGNYVIVRDLRLHLTDDTANVIGGFSLEEGDFTLVSDDPKVLSFGGRSTISMFDRGLMGPESLSPAEAPNDANIDDGYWRWGSDSYGGIMARAIVEANLETPPSLPQFGYPTAFDGRDWNDDFDSNGVAWPYFSGEFRSPIGTNLLELYQQLYGFGVELEVDARTFWLSAFNPGGYGDDLTGVAFGAGVVRFVAGVNIAADLGRVIHGRLRTTHLLVKTTDYPGGAYIPSDDYTPGDVVYKRVYQSGDISGDPTNSSILNDRAQRNMDLRGSGEDGIRIPIVTGSDPSAGLYMPGPHFEPGPTPPHNARAGEGLTPTAGDVWVGDIVTIDTGDHTMDYQDASRRIEAVEYVLRDGGDWQVILHFGPVQWLTNTSLQPMGGTLGIPLPIELCRPGTLGSAGTTRLYFSSGISAISPAAYAGWDDVDAGGIHVLLGTPDGSFGATHQAVTSIGGAVGGRDVCLWRATYGPLSAAEAAQFAAGGLIFDSQTRARMRFGIGINEAGQDGISQEVLRIVAPDGVTFRGTALDLHALASSAGSSKWPAQATKINKTFPPAAAPTVTLAAVPSAQAGDYVVYEPGIRNFSTVTSGAAIALTNNNASDLPDDDVDANPFNSWVQWSTGEDIVLTDVGDGHPLLIGSSVRAKRCDDTEHFFMDRAPTPSDDFASAGMRRGTHWIWVDDVDNPTVSFGSFEAFDVSAEDAIWIQISGGTAHSHEVDEITSPLVDHGDMGATEVLTFEGSQSDHIGTLTDDVTFSFAGGVPGERSWLTLVMTDDGSGPYALTWPGAVVWPGDEAPAPPEAGEALVVTFFTDDAGATIYGSYPGTGSTAAALIVREVAGTDIDPVAELEFDASDFIVTDQSGGTARVALTHPIDSLDDVPDVIITAVATGDVLTWNGSAWVNAEPATGSPSDPARGEILIADTHSTPLVFGDLLQNEAQDDLVYADP